MKSHRNEQTSNISGSDQPFKKRRIDDDVVDDLASPLLLQMPEILDQLVSDFPLSDQLSCRLVCKSFKLSADRVINALQTPRVQNIFGQVERHLSDNLLIALPPRFDNGRDFFEPYRQGRLYYLFTPKSELNGYIAKNLSDVLRQIFLEFREWKTQRKHAIETEFHHTKNKDIYFCNRIANKFNKGRLVDAITAIANLHAEEDSAKKAYNIFYDDQCIMRLCWTDNNANRYEHTRDNIFCKKIGIVKTLQVFDDLQVCLDEYVLDRNNVYIPRYAVRGITPQERAVLAENQLHGLKPQQYMYANTIMQHEWDQMPDLGRNLLRRTHIKSGILHRAGTRRYSCASGTLKDFQQHSNKGDSFMKSVDEYIPYIDTRTRQDQGPVKVQGGGMVLLDLASIPKDHIHGQGKLDAVVNIDCLRWKESSSEETAAARESAFRNREIHLESIPSAAILAWRAPGNAWGPLRDVTAPRYRYEDSRGGSGNLTPQRISNIEGLAYRAYILAPGTAYPLDPDRPAQEYRKRPTPRDEG